MELLRSDFFFFHSWILKEPIIVLDVGLSFDCLGNSFWFFQKELGVSLMYLRGAWLNVSTNGQKAIFFTIKYILLKAYSKH